jgi:tetratricopeptide (TPR) repeat protein
MMKEKGDSIQNNPDKDKPKREGRTGDNNIFSVIQQYVDQNSKKIIGISIAVVIAVALFFVIRGIVQKNQEEDRQQASVTLTRILPYYQANDCQKALYGDPTKTVRNQKIIGLVEIVDKYKGTKQGKIAALYAGNCFLTLNKTDKAIEYFDIALDSPSQIVMEGASAGLGKSNELKGNYKDAASNYEKASGYSITYGAKDRYQFYAGLCYEKLGEKDKAEKIYREIVNANRSEFVGPAKTGLVRLGTIIE